jgi:hypothetical protein
MFNKLIKATLTAGAIISLSACSDDDGQQGIAVPTTYEFTRDGQSTVSFQGQTDRLNMLSEIKAYINNGDKGEMVDATVLMNMYVNENSPFSSEDLNSSTKQLKNKTALADVTHFENLFTESEQVSSANTTASPGVAGRIERGTGSGKFILVNEKGWEFTQFVEKGIMGAVFYNQIFNNYMTDAKVGDDVENTALKEGKNYTAMEHHWDEAFGYWGVPVDFPQGDPVLEENESRFWASYTNGRDAFLGVNRTLMDAYLTGRTAIVNKDYTLKDEQRDIIYKQHELVAAATAVHYLNEAIDDLAAEDMGNYLHHMSEAYNFVKAVSYSPYKNLSDDELDTILNSYFGTNADFWTATVTDLQNAKSAISGSYPEIAPVADQL